MTAYQGGLKSSIGMMDGNNGYFLAGSIVN